MLQVIKKWRIVLTFSELDQKIIFYIYDNHYSNMIRKLGEFSPINDPIKIEINEEK